MNESTNGKLPQILRIHQLSARIGLSRSAIYDKISPVSKRFDASFPRPIKLGASAVGWQEVLVTHWLNLRIAAASQKADEQREPR